MTSHITKIFGVDIHWLDVGTGPTVVLIHGLSDWHRAWQPVTERLAARGFRVLAVDLPGHGLSGRSDVPYTLEWNARVIGAWLDALNVETASIVGHSYGGGVAQMLILTHAARMERLGLVAPGGFGRRVNVAVRLASMPFLLQHFGQPWLSVITHLAGPLGGRKSWDKDERAWANSRPGTARALHRTVKDVIGMSGQVRHFLDRAHEAPFVPPVTVYWGDKDRVLPVAHGKRLPKLLPGARIVRFKDAGHYPHHDDPDAFTNELEKFLREDRPHYPTIRGARAASAKELFDFFSFGPFGGEDATSPASLLPLEPAE